LIFEADLKPRKIRCHSELHKARYGEKKATFEIETLNVLEGSLPVRVRNLIVEWVDLHKQELKERRYKRRILKLKH